MATQYVISTSNVALAAATAKTVVVGSTDASGPPPEWVSCDIAFDGVTAGAGRVRVDFCTFATVGTGTSFTPKKFGQAVGVARSTWQINNTAEGTTPTILFSWWLLPDGGTFPYQWPLGRELFHPVSTIQGIRLTAPAVVNAIVNLTIEE